MPQDQITQIIEDTIRWRGRSERREKGSIIGISPPLWRNSEFELLNSLQRLIFKVVLHPQTALVCSRLPLLS